MKEQCFFKKLLLRNKVFDIHILDLFFFLLLLEVRILFLTVISAQDKNKVAFVLSASRRHVVD